MPESRAELLARAVQIRDEFRTNANSPARVGGALYQFAAAMQLTGYDVTGYGAVGDGTTDDTDAIQEAVDALGAAGGGELIFPAGTFVSGPIEFILDNVHVRGAGAGATILKLKASPLADQGGLLTFGKPLLSSTPTPILNCSVQDLSVDGNKANQFQGTTASNGVNTGILAFTVDGFLIRNVIVHDCDGYGIGLQGTDYEGRENWYIDNVESYDNNYDGIDLKGGTTHLPSRIHMQKVYCHDNGPGPIVARDCVGIDLRGELITLVSCYAYDNDTHGIRVRDGDKSVDASFFGCWAISNGGTTRSGFQVDGSDPNNGYKFFGGGAIGNTGPGYRLDNGICELHGVHTSSNAERGVYNLSNATQVKMFGGEVSSNILDGVRIDHADSTLTMHGTVVKESGLNGIRFDGSVLILDGCEILDNDQDDAGWRGVQLNSSNVTWWSITGGRITDTQGSPTQTHGVRFEAGVAAGVLDSYLLGNQTGPFSGTMPAGTRYTGPSANVVGASVGSTLTIASGVVTATSNVHVIDTEGAAATDDLDTVSGTVAGQMIVLMAANDARDVVCKDGTGNLRMAGDFILNNTDDRIMFLSNGTNLFEICRSDNGA
jgi:hypothetical protein